MPTDKRKPTAYDRVKNANNASDLFIKTDPWTNDVEDLFDAWVKTAKLPSLADQVGRYLESEVAVSFKLLEGSVCCTLAHQPNRAASLPYLLTGWSDNALDAMAVATYKLQVMMKGIWEAPEMRPAPRRR
jgi:hypothetical protein